MENRSAGRGDSCIIMMTAKTRIHGTLAGSHTQIQAHKKGSHYNYIPKSQTSKLRHGEGLDCVPRLPSLQQFLAG